MSRTPPAVWAAIDAAKAKRAAEADALNDLQDDIGDELADREERE